MKTVKTSQVSAGDRVKVEFLKKDYEGTVLETPEDEKGILLLKLDSGYNIGLIRKEIFDISILKKAEERKEEGREIKQDSKKPNIAMIITGGTIAARLNPKKGGVDWLTSPDMLFKFYPKLFEKVNVSKVEVPFMKASEDMDYKDWQKLAKTAEKLLDDENIKGLIITHGTDTLHYTSAALSFMLKNLNKPVVLTYSQRSVDRASSDASLNLQCAALAAISDIAEVMLVGHANSSDDFCFAMPGTKVKKMHSSRRDAFKVINGKPIAKIFEDRIEFLPGAKFKHKEQAAKGKEVKAEVSFEEKVALIKFYPGQDPEIIDYYLKQGYKGLVIEITGLGHVATKRARLGWTRKLENAIKRGMTICAVTQCINGRVDPLVYSNGRELLETGIIYLEDMLAETAFVKLSWVLGHNEWNKNREKIKEEMLKNMSHELNDRLEFEDGKEEKNDKCNYLTSTL